MNSVDPFSSSHASMRTLTQTRCLNALCFFTDTRYGHGFNEERTPEELKGEGGQ